MRFYLIILFFTGLFFLSCSKEKDIFQEQDGKMILNISSGKARTVKSDFVSGEKVGLYLVNYAGSEPGILGNVNYSNELNVPYTFNGSLWYNINGNDIFLNENLADLYTYYPFDEEMSKSPGKMDLSAYPFSIETNQESNSTKNDFLWAKVSGLSADNPVANVVYQHLMSQIKINLIFSNPVTEDPELKIYKTKTSANINLRVGEVSPKDESQIILPAKTGEQSNEMNYEAILIPQIIEKGTPIFTININDETFIYEAEENIELLSQKNYIFNMGVNNPPVSDQYRTSGSGVKFNLSVHEYDKK